MPEGTTVSEQTTTVQVELNDAELAILQEWQEHTNTRTLTLALKNALYRIDAIRDREQRQRKAKHP